MTTRPRSVRPGGCASSLAVFALAGTAVFLAASLILPSVSSAQQVDVCVDFAQSGIDAGDRADFLAKLQSYFSSAGLGAGDAKRVIVHDNKTPPATCHLNVTFRGEVKSKAGQTVYAKAHKKQRSATISRSKFSGQSIGGPDSERRREGMAQTTAHEIAHLLCAVHDCLGNGKKRVKQPNNSVTDETCDAALNTLMTVGSCVPAGDRGWSPLITGARSFSDDSVAQIKGGITDLFDATKQPWDLNANFDAGTICLVQGHSHVEPIEDTTDPNADLSAEDLQIDFHYQVSGALGLFEWGWLNIEDEFITPPVATPDQILEAPGNTRMNFALRGLPGSGFEGQVFAQSLFATISFGTRTNQPSEALDPPLTVPYHTDVIIDFVVSGNVVSLYLDTGAWAGSNGFTDGALCVDVVVGTPLRWRLPLLVASLLIGAVMVLRRTTAVSAA